ncbi:ATP-dependent endonuclease [Mesorhizobium sp. B3-1-3]|uniref:ATP-dependent nuclease n=1 Tax=unclassified Mesorhizobium TaxID=325217 RepID=UPI001129BCCF|nr:MULTISPECIES: AAA family ATPase [unclassified Mesorhizobium]TPI62589.1 ATP-dependent endonuclease [Mesorhizobium sp. B3-1-8]TPI74159.1 ATP-dependent endonuclease [Mesorhizobium sp. B3-1-3]
MELKTIRIQNFRSVEDSGDFSVEHLTCLVGKNEAGKTAILQALAGLNSHPATPFQYDVERDYPKRFLARYSERHTDKQAVVATTTWEIDETQKALIAADFGADAVTGDRVTITRSYNAAGHHWSVPLDAKRAVEYLIANANFSAPEKSQLGIPSTSEELVAKLNELAGSNPKHKALLDKVLSYPHSSFFSRVRQILEPYFPQFMYFSVYDRMNTAVHLPTLNDRMNDGTLFTNDQLRGDRLFWEFLEYSGVPLGDILGATTFESFNARLQAASNVLTEEILEYWTQNQDIEVRVNVTEGKPGDPAPFNSGAVGRARIYNQLHRADTSFSERSAGFTWFFSFLIKFDRVKKEAKGKVFLLLDEPGLTLHGLAQADLLRYFSEKLSPHHQMIYSTHSPFMVPHENLMASRIVQDIVKVGEKGRRTPTGTQVRDDVLNADRDSVFPLQGALGYSLTQTLFVGKHTILVEGPGDILYLQALSAELARRSRTGLDPSWVLCPAGGIDKIHSFVSLFGGNNLDVIALSDYTKKDRNKLDALRRSQIIKDGGVLTMADFTAQEEADVEDLFDPKLFCSIVNSAYGLSGSNALDPAKLKAADEGTERLVKKAEAYFRVLPESIPGFDHFTPSHWLLTNPGALSGDAPEVLNTLGRAETLFKALNALRKR